MYVEKQRAKNSEDSMEGNSEGDRTTRIQAVVQTSANLPTKAEERSWE